MRMSERGNKILYFVLSFLLAIVLWLYVDDAKGNTIPKTFNNIPIEFIGAEDTLPNRNLMVTSGADATIDLRISGPRTMVSGLTRDDIRVQADLSSIGAEGRYPCTLNIYYPDHVDRTKISLEYQSRSAVTVQVSPMYSKTVSVSPSVVNNDVAPGYIYMANKLTLDPDTLTLRGREEDVEKVVSARVVVDVGGASATVQQEVSYELLDSEGNVVPSDGIWVSEKRINLTAPVYLSKELPLTVSFKSSPGSQQEDIRYELSEKSITVVGESASLENMTEINLGEIDLSALLSNQEERELDIAMPAGCENNSGILKVKLTVQFQGMETRNIPVTNISSIGLSENQRFSKVTQSVDVTLRGPADELDSVTEEDVRIVVDLTNYGNGTVNVPATVYVDGHNDLVGAIGSYTVMCKILS